MLCALIKMGAHLGSGTGGATATEGANRAREDPSRVMSATAPAPTSLPRNQVAASFARGGCPVCDASFRGWFARAERPSVRGRGRGFVHAGRR